MPDIEKFFDASEWPGRWNTNEGEELHSSATPETLQSGALAALKASDLESKVSLTRSTARAWFQGTLGIGGSKSITLPDRPGRPEKPALVPPTRVKKRSLKSPEGRFALLHAIAHIELNAVDLAWDIVARFSGQNMPRSFFDGWVRVALEESKHFSLLQERLGELGGAYGDLDAHDGLWEAAQNTDHDLTARLAIVPLILEARGLDITPSLIRQIEAIGDTKSARIFQIIYRDEQGHVAVGQNGSGIFVQKKTVTLQQRSKSSYESTSEAPSNRPSTTWHVPEQALHHRFIARSPAPEDKTLQPSINHTLRY